MASACRANPCLLVAMLAVTGCSPSSRGAAPSEEIATVQDPLSSCLTLGAAGDAMLSNPPMGQSFGAMPIMRAGGKDESVVRFDLASIPSAAAIDSATLKLYISGSGSNAAVNAHRVTAPWSEPSVTYATFAQHFDPAVLAAFTSSSVNVQKSLDLTALVQSWTAGNQPNFGVLLETASDKKTIFVTREGGTTQQKPQLQVCFSLPGDHCSPNPCRNGAACVNGAASYTCECAPGYSGDNCETVIDNCASSPCLNGGACTNATNGYTCECAPGYSGNNCETVIDNCASRPCLNGGTCTNAANGYTCACAPGYTGQNCQTIIDNCASSPCLNGGTCTNVASGFMCACAPGYTGQSCEINVNECASQPCRNGGTCVDGLNTYTCSCPADWGGAICDVNLNSCSQSPCLNGGACTNGYGSYTCGCAPGYTGANCEIDINDCAPNPCQNGGICSDGVNSHTCICSAGFVGPNCETPACIGGLFDKNNCGGCGVVCSGDTPLCVDGKCVSACPAGSLLTACNALGTCHDPATDNGACGGCPGMQCAADQGCIAGACASAGEIAPITIPAKCSAEPGPNIALSLDAGPDDAQADQCSGAIAATSFTFALCTCHQYQAGGSVSFDAFDSTAGPYPNASTLGGSIASNGGYGLLSNVTITGDVWSGTSSFLKNGPILENLHVNGNLSQSGNTVNGNVYTSGTTIDQVSVGGILCATSCASYRSGCKVIGVDPECPLGMTPPDPCKRCSPSEQVPIQSFVAHYSTPANNDNDALGIANLSTRLDGDSSVRRVDLPCGYYYFNRIENVGNLIIAAHGNTAIFVGGSVNVGGIMTIAVDPAAHLDLFVAGDVRASVVQLGSAMYPSHLRIYIGSSCKTGGNSCTQNGACCSGTCSSGTCAAGSSFTAPADWSLATGASSFYAANVYAPNGRIFNKAQSTFFGGILANDFESGGSIALHYDKATASEAAACTLPSECSSCLDCANQACINGTCGACQNDGQCCAPLRCDPIDHSCKPSSQ